MAVSLAPTIGIAYQSFTNGGLPNDSGYIDTFIAGGTTPIIGTLLATHYAGQWLPLAIFFTLLAGLSLFGRCCLARPRGETSATPQPALQ